MTGDRAIEIFNHWFDQEGHWLFGINGKASAMAVWKEHGIEGLPNFVQGGEAKAVSPLVKN